MKRRGLYDVTNYARSSLGLESQNTDDQTNRSRSSTNIKRNDMTKSIKKVIKKDFFFLSEYSKDIFMYLLLQEVRLGQQIHSRNQCQLKHRGEMFMWFISVANKTHISNDCVHLAIALFDRYCLLADQIDSSYIGIITLWIASKVEDSFPVALKDVMKQTQFPYDAEIKNHCLKLELEVLRVLDFSINIPTPIQFLRHFTKISKTNETCHQISKFIIDMSLSESRFIGLPYSLMAASSFCIACDLVKHVPQMGDSWNMTLQRYSSLEKIHLLPVMKELALMLVNSNRILKSAIPLYKRYSKTVDCRHLSKENMRNYQYKIPSSLI